MTFQPIAPLKLVQGPGVNPQPCASTAPNLCVTFQQKTIQELFTTDYGRMNAILGTELPLTNFLTQTTIPLAYIDPVTEIMQDGETQLWKITHNGVDTHFIHFHLFNVQVVNRMGWDGSIRPPDANEIGWKDTVRMNPLEDVLVGLQPVKPSLPWPLPDSIRAMDVTAPMTPTTQFTGVDPFSNNPAPVPMNGPTNFGWEYVWHCHILGHEENDMMRPMMFQVNPPAPSNLMAKADLVTPGKVDLSWTDNSASETGFIVQRATDPAFRLNLASFAVGPSTSKTNAAAQGVDWGSTITAGDTPGAGVYYYRVQAVDDAFKGALAQAWNTTAALVSTWSNTATLGGSAPNPGVSPSSILFLAQQLVNTTSGPMSVTVSNGMGAGTLAISGISLGGVNSGDFAISANTCGAALAGGASCSISLTFKPLAAGARSALLVITNSNSANLSISVSGIGITPIAGVSAQQLSFGSIAVGTTSATQNLKLSNTGTATLNNVVVSVYGGNAGDFKITNNACGAAVPANQSCLVTVAFAPAAIGARNSVLVITSSDPVNPMLNVSLTGTGTGPGASLAPASITFASQLAGTTSAGQTVTLTNTGSATLVISKISNAGGNTADFTLGSTCPIGGAGLAANGKCSITVKFAPTGGGMRSTTLTVASNFAGSPAPTVALNGLGLQPGALLSPTSIAFGSVTRGQKSASQPVTLTNNGNTPLSITGISTAAPFSVTNDCGSSLVANANCTITVVFSPTKKGPFTGTVQITDNAPGSPQKVTLSGTGL